MNKVLKLSYCLFFNGERGVEILKLFKTKKFRTLNLFIIKENYDINDLSKITNKTYLK